MVVSADHQMSLTKRDDPARIERGPGGVRRGPVPKEFREHFRQRIPAASVVALSAVSELSAL